MVELVDSVISPPELIQLALQRRQAGNLRAAQQHCRKALQIEPDNSEALHLLGLIARQRQNYDAAADLIQQAITLRGSEPSYHCNLGSIFRHRGKLSAAIDCYRQALALQPAFAEAHQNMGEALATQGKFAEAAASFQRALALNPDLVAAHNGLGNVSRVQGKLNDAIVYFRRALSLRPDHAGTHYNLGLACYDADKLADASVCLRQALALDANFAAAHAALGNVARRQGDLDAALLHCRRALQLDPRQPRFYHYLGLALHATDQFAAAAQQFRQALALNPTFSKAQIDLGNALRLQGEPRAAIACCQRVLKSQPDNAVAHYNLGLALYELRQFAAAAEHYQRTLALQPSLGAAHNDLGLALKDMGRTRESLTHFGKAVALNPSNVIADSNRLLYLNYASGYDRGEIFNAHRAFNDRHAAGLAARRDFSNTPDPARRLRLGYVAPDFRQHANSYFIEPLLAQHCHDQFEVFCYFTDSRSDSTTQRIHRRADHWTDCVQLNNAELAKRIVDDGIDILIDLAGHTANNRLLLFARKPAPVQVAYLGYPNTRGLPAIDYRVSDHYIEPAGDADAYSTETLIRMPASWYCYRPPDAAPPVNELPALRNGFVTFGSLNQYCKTNSAVLQVWAQILRAVPNSRLLMNTNTRSLNDAPTRAVFIKKMARLGIARDRLILDDQRPADTHVRTYHRVDIGLETFPHNGGITTLEALWMGVPVATLVGEGLAARMGLSILSTLGLTELITQTPEDYVATCVGMANDIERLRDWRAGMRARMQQSALMDTLTFTRQLEAHYRKMWQQWCAEE